MTDKHGYMEDRRHRHREKALELFENKCNHCEAREGKFAFSRIEPDPQAKIMAHQWERSWDNILIELMEHELLCYSCVLRKRHNV